MKNIVEDVYSLDGFYSDLKLSKNELEDLRKIVRCEYLDRIKSIYSSKYKDFEEYPMDMYHSICSSVDHKELWPKKYRCLNSKNIEMVRSFKFFNELKNIFGKLDITDEDNIGREEIYWRLVRPNCNEDVGPIHADCWFWELNKPEERMSKRIKIWMPVFCDDEDTGFKFVPNSHKQEWDYTHELKDGKFKPIPNLEEPNINSIKFLGKPGDIIVFNDKLLHGGYTTPHKTRVSLEFTLKLK